MAYHHLLYLPQTQAYQDYQDPQRTPMNGRDAYIEHQSRRLRDAEEASDPQEVSLAAYSLANALRGQAPELEVFQLYRKALENRQEYAESYYFNRELAGVLF